MLSVFLFPIPFFREVQNTTLRERPNLERPKLYLPLSKVEWHVHTSDLTRPPFDCTDSAWKTNRQVEGPILLIDKDDCRVHNQTTVSMDRVDQ